MRTPDGRVLVLCPSFLSHAPINSLVHQLECEAADMETNSRVALLTGFVCLAGAALAGIACWPGSSGRR